MTDKKWYRPDVDGLRAIAVLAVITNHFSHSLLPGGFLGVDIFFVISGYVITNSLYHYPHNPFDLFLAFYSRRVKRLLPALIVCVLVTCFIGSFLISQGEPEYSSSLEAGLASLLGLSNIYFYHQSLDYLGASAVLNLFTHTWSLGVEEQFYIFFPTVFWLTRNNVKGCSNLFMILAVLSILSFLGYVGSASEFKSAYYLMPYRFWELGLGCMIAVPLKWVRLGDVGYAPWLACFGMAAALIIPGQPGQVYSTIVVAIGTAVLINTVVPDHPVFRLFVWQPLLTIGLMSYSLYLWHWPVLVVSRWTVGVDKWSAPFQIALIFMLATLSYRFIENPLRKVMWAPSNLLSIGVGLAVSTCSGIFIVALWYGAFGPLYTSKPVRLEAKGIETLMDRKFYAGQLSWDPEKCVLSSDRQVGKKITRDLCMLKPAPWPERRQFVVIGNSFSAAEFEMYSVLSEMELGTVVATSSWGASPVPDIPNRSGWSRANDYYWDYIVPSLVKPLGPGDVLIMINDLNDFTPEAIDKQVASDLALLKKGLDLLSKAMAASGVQIIFQSQNPLLREANCSPDMAQVQWFNIRGSLKCHYYSKEETLRRIAPLRKVLDDVQSKNRNFHVLDLFDVMCPGELCAFQNSDGIFLYRDTFSHPSIEANRLARPQLLAVLKEAAAIPERPLQIGAGQ